MTQNSNLIKPSLCGFLLIATYSVFIFASTVLHINNVFLVVLLIALLLAETAICAYLSNNITDPAPALFVFWGFVIGFDVVMSDANIMSLLRSTAVWFVLHILALSILFVLSRPLRKRVQS